MREKREKPGLIFIVSGPSGSGKTTVVETILRDDVLKNKVMRSVSLTTRPKRPAERDKRDYFFISEEKFEQQRRSKKILEWTKYLGYYYATPKDFVEKQFQDGKHIILCLDLKGAAQIKRFYPVQTITVFIAPPSLDELRYRIKNRCSLTGDDEIKQRLIRAKKELAEAHKYDYCLVNQDLGRTVKRLKKIIMKNIT